MNNVMDIRELKQKDLIRCADVFSHTFRRDPWIKTWNEAWNSQLALKRY